VIIEAMALGKPVIATNIPGTTEIVLDKVTAKFAPKHWQGKHAGSQAILQYIKSKSPKYVFCGHIHEGQGTAKIGETEVYNLGVGEYKIVEF